jgi:hypothetical protein
MSSMDITDKKYKHNFTLSLAVEEEEKRKI